ncbi:spermatogenesis- and oogenesis-specific basic helix-loop-helix-containing protein 1-like [Suncus etruscus]|uniref:spermatogenesis- and oogenesis-specific basic helix-loop-helix-containing protein 1-like n=1 Tax=Suncus etruscus TaxID=109475 RepID=UPI002110B404|nr:spermatogenesis- and oogenesis-specific basic helix-loop-helix-containing protein 1-like [Suncus etruscus]
MGCGQILLWILCRNFPRPCVVSRHRVDPREGPVLPKNVLSERERRKRISGSCARLRTLLPHFEGRREDMASVLEMAVQFLRLVRPGGDDSTRQDLVQVATAAQLSMDPHDDDDDDEDGSGVALPRAPGCASSTVVTEAYGGPQSGCSCGA